MAIVIGASALVLKVLICCGTLSSRTRNFSLGMLGMKLPLLSSTDTSTCTAVTSLWKVGRLVGTSLSFLYWDGMGGWSVSVVVSAGAAGFFGFGTGSRGWGWGSRCGGGGGARYSGIH